ncbi:hypothetical protein ACH4FA_36905 [Streptomyces sp. NPDC017966]|uniref:Uncharacterized protein n=1 Tax=Streptomyces griseoincarnatus TaxID=29305 RepID=A0ABT0W407_STRGI|nr:hypothetical protein [Streptomyces griseoincarnatus]MCM2518307.1 hypothetical protein [Streptomyces griseoincarnatus]
MTENRWDKYRTIIESSGNFHVAGVHELLRVMGKQRAGAIIVQDLEEALAAHNIGHLPPRIPRDQNAKILLYNQDMPGAGFVLHLVRQLVAGETSAGATTDQQIAMLSMSLGPYRPALEKDASSA